MVDIDDNNDDDGSRDIGTDREGRRRGIVKFLRDVVDKMENIDEGRESEIGLGTVKWETGFGFIHVEYGFTEFSISPHSTFKFRPAANPEHGGSNRQGSDIENLGGQAGKIGKFINNLGDLPLEFAELDAASQGHMNLTGYEFTYETALNLSDVDGLTDEEFDNLVRDL